MVNLAPSSMDDLRKSAARELLSRRQARRNLLDFTRYTWPGYLTNWHHKVLAEKLTRVANGELKRLMVFMPPRHGKSELVSVRFPAFLLGLNPNLQVLTCSHTVSLATDLHRNCQRVIMSRQYRNLFPETTLSETENRGVSDVPPRRTSTVAEVVGHGGVLRSAGVGVAIAGKGFDIGIVDDPFEGHKQADSPVERETVWNWYLRDFLTRRSSDDAAIVLTHTRWHRDDLAGRLIAQEADEREHHKWETVCFRGIRREEKNPDDPREPGEVLWPWRMSEAGMRAAEADPRGFSALYQQDPTAEGGVEWPADCFEDFIWSDSKIQPFGVVAVDPSKGREAKKGDFSAIVYVGVGDNRGDTLHVDAIVDRVNPTLLIEKLMDFCEVYRPRLVGVETNQFQSLLINEIEHRCDKFPSSHLAALVRGGRIVELENFGEKKELRIRRISKYIVRRQFRYKNTMGCRLLVNQLRDFPLAAHDDGPDALEMAIRIAEEHLGGVAPVESYSNMLQTA